MGIEKSKGLKELNKKLQNIKNRVDEFYDNLENISTDFTYDELIESFSDFEYSDKKLTKKQKREKEDKVIEFMRKKFPEFVKSFTELDVVLDGIEFLVQEKKDRFESIMENICEIEDMKEEIERRKEDLEF